MNHGDNSGFNSLTLPIDGTPPESAPLEVFRRGARNMLWLTVREGRTLILKGLPENLRNHPEEVSRLRKEYALGLRINHPGVVGVYGFEIHPSTGPIIVMEYIDGSTLHQFLNEGTPQPVGVRLGIACQIADALCHIHSLGVSHRDLKPDNILITRRSDAKIIDWGLGDSEDATTFKNSLATPEFGAPEQQQPFAADSSADVYSFGRILQHLLPEKRFQKLRDACMAGQPQQRLTIRDVSESLSTIYQNKDRVKFRKEILIAIIMLIVGMSGYLAFTHLTDSPQADDYRLPLSTEQPDSNETTDTGNASENIPAHPATPASYDAIYNEYQTNALNVIKDIGPGFNHDTGNYDERIMQDRATKIPELCNDFLAALIDAGCPYDEMSRLMQLLLDDIDKAYNRIDGINE